MQHLKHKSYSFLNVLPWCNYIMISANRRVYCTVFDHVFLIAKRSNRVDEKTIFLLCPDLIFILFTFQLKDLLFILLKRLKHVGGELSISLEAFFTNCLCKRKI